jgi:phospholipase C
MVKSIEHVARRVASAVTASVALLAVASSAHTPQAGAARSAPVHSGQDAARTATPIKHLVVIFGENQSFDHYFGTYPRAANPAGEPAFLAAPGTPQVNGYLRHPELLTRNSNTTSAANLATGIAPSLMNPFRIDRAQFDTKSQNHAYTPEQRATNKGRMDGFVAYTGRDHNVGAGAFGTAAQVMGYFDGNTVTAMWNYAQHFAMSDNAWTDSFGPSTPGALNVVAGTTNGGLNATAATVPDGQGGFTLINDSDPTGDTCSAKGDTIEMSGRNIGDLLNAAGITWGGFMGGFDLTATNANGSTGCKRSTVSPNTGRTPGDYSPHHAWFQYYASTRNPQHTRPSSVAMIGRTEPVLDRSATPVHHQYDYRDFVAAVKSGHFPSVSYLKAPGFQDGHPGNSNPLDEQAFLATTLNFLQQQAEWKNTAVIILYDDSDGWYDHQAPRVQTSSFDPKADQMTAPGRCEGPGSRQGIGVKGQPVNGRCGPGSRTPFLVISPYARANYVDHAPISQASVLRFIEDNWLGARRIGGGSNDDRAGSIMGLFDFRALPRVAPFFIDPVTGLRTSSAPSR